MKKEIIRSLAMTALASAAAITALSIISINNTNKSIERHIFASKVNTINKVYNQYETSNVTGYSNCIKSHNKDLCLKRMELISIHFANEYNKKLLKLITDEYGIETIENKKSGRLTAIGIIPNNLEFILGGTYTKLNQYPANLNKGANKDLKDISENKDEVVSIGNKFAELGLKAQLDAYKEIETPDLIKLLELEQANNVNSGGIGKSPSIMDKTIQSGKQLFDTHTKAFKESASKPIEDNK
ncbi:hypothetical protein GR140_18865 [Pseudomonas putida]|uniref:hypothetical protein n=1 Tax=Pseudomonas putida TaxID=303 RepID=UPI001BAFF0FB|nr:hypothetical protein [Pseudomonas putida]QUG90727.1 hypothetical protein GR140_18865 [Pseudomonas putida]